MPARQQRPRVEVELVCLRDLKSRTLLFFFFFPLIFRQFNKHTIMEKLFFLNLLSIALTISKEIIKYILFLLYSKIFKKIFLLKYGCFIMCQSLLYSKVTSCTHIDILLYILFHYGLSQDLHYSSLCYTLGPCLSIRNVVICIQLPQAPSPSLSLPCSY